MEQLRLSLAYWLADIPGVVATPYSRGEFLEVMRTENKRLYSGPMQYRSAERLKIGIALCVAWMICSAAPLWKYLSHPAAIAAICVGCVGIDLGLYGIGRLSRRGCQIGFGWFVLIFIFFVAAFAVLYPISLKHVLNGGSDREDALRIELAAVSHHKYPYDARTFLGNPPTPLPGALLLAAPFYAIGHIAWQNLLWLLLFLIFLVRYFRFRITALFFVLAFLLCSPSNLNDFTTGGDYLTNFFYVTVAMALFVRSLKGPLFITTVAAVLLGISLSSRGVYGLLLFPLLALILQRTTYIRAAALFTIILVSAAAVTFPVFMPHPVVRFVQQLGQNTNKLRYLPQSLHPRLLLPGIALLVASSALLLRMDVRRVFLLFSVSSCIVLAPPVIALTIHMGRLPFECSYLAISVLSFALWVLPIYEEAIAESAHKRSTP